MPKKQGGVEEWFVGDGPPPPQKQPESPPSDENGDWQGALPKRRRRPKKRSSASSSNGSDNPWKPPSSETAKKRRKAPPKPKPRSKAASTPAKQAKPRKAAPSQRDWTVALRGPKAGGSKSAGARKTPRGKRDVASLEAKVEQLDKELKAGERREDKLRKELEKARRGGRPAPRGKLEINSVSFEQLRALGLTVTQSARLIGAREMQGGFDSLDDLDKLQGFPRETLAELKSRLRKPSGRSQSAAK